MDINIIWTKLQPKYNNLSEKYKDISLPEFYRTYTFNDFDNVYEPAEDSFLLSDTIEEELVNNNFSDEEYVSIEVGCGSSFVSANYLKKCLSSKNDKTLIKHHFCFDINPDCIKVSTKIINTEKLDYITTIKEEYFFNSDIIVSYITLNKIKNIIFLFNPPYVTTDDEELERAKKDKDIFASWAGGNTGSEVILDFIEFFNNFVNKTKNLIDKITLYLLLSSENDIDKIIKSFKSTNWECLSITRAKNERLGIFKIIWNNK